MFTHASIIPLIGGETIAQQKVFNSLPSALYSYKAFYNNDQHLLNYYGDKVPYYVIDEGNAPIRKYDVINSVCPCAGLSSLSTSAGVDNPMNDWMIRTANFVLSELRPEVFWGENAPRLGSKSGEKVVERLLKIANENNYTMTIYRTKSLLHGLPQVRERTFYFFWRGNQTPILSYFHKEHGKIEDLVSNASSIESQNFSTKNDKPSDEPYYKYVLEEMICGTHKDFFNKIEKSTGPFEFIESNDVSYLDVAKWMKANGYEKQAKRCDTIYHKLKSGKNIMRRASYIPKGYIGAFVGHLSTMMTHPYIDRYITVREALSIMGMPEDFELLEPKKNINHICQNVPVTTAMDMANEVKEYLMGNRETVQKQLVYQYNHKQIHKIKEFKNEVDLNNIF